MELFRTDFYQMSMMLAYLMLNQHNDEVVFEAFVRKINPDVNPDLTHYRFSGSVSVYAYIDTIKKELRDMNKVMDLFCQIVLPKVHPALRNNYRNKIKYLVENKLIDTQFEYNVYPQGGIVKPLVPVFQYIGPKWLGQLMETRICLIINGKTGFNTNDHCADGTTGLVYPNRADLDVFNDYLKELDNEAKAIRNCTGAQLMEASYRRAPSDEVANAAAQIAIRNGWNGTSNVGAYLDGLVPLDRVGGTMAHSFVMSHRQELDAFRNWDYVWPDSTMIIDTYDCLEAAKLLIDNRIYPKDVRIDSDPLDRLVTSVQKRFNKAGVNRIGSYISGDLGVEKLGNLHHIPFQKAMVGTKYVSQGIAKAINCGFVYKIMRVTDSQGTFYPEKKSTGKTHRNGLKKLWVNSNNQIVMGTCDHYHDFRQDLCNVNPALDVIYEN